MLARPLADSFTYRIAAAIICITCIFYSNVIRKRNRIRFRLFRLLLIITLIDSLTEFGHYAAVYSPFPDTIKWILSYGMQLLYYSTHFGMIPVFVFYVIMICGIRYKFNFVHRSFIKVPFYLLEVMLLTNPVTQFTFSITGKFTYVRGPGIYIAYGVSAVYLGIGLYLLARHWRTMNNMKKIAMVYFLSLATLGTAIQMLIPQVKCELLGEAIGLSGLLLMIEKDDDRTDVYTGSYNRSALVQDLGSFFTLGRNFVTVCIRIGNLYNFSKLLGYKKTGQIMTQISDFLMNLDEDELNIYYVQGGIYYGLYEGVDAKKARSIAQKIEERFEENWGDENEGIKLDVKILLANCPEQFKTINDIFLLANVELEDEKKKIYSGSDLDFLLRRIEVEKAIGRGISEKTFAVCYRPIYCKKENLIKLAEVSLKLNDAELGELLPEEFMHVAETSGFIEEMQYMTIEAVCRFLSSGVDTSDMQLDYCMIPIMSAVMVKKEFANRVERYLEHYKIDPSLMAFVIHESDVLYGKEALYYITEVFERIGIKLFISDYTEEYFGLEAFSAYQISGAILNVKNIFEADKTDNSDIVLENRINMINQLEKTVILSGIDTMAYYDKIKDMDVDFIEGDLLSPTVTKNELQNKFWHGERVIVHNNGIERIAEDDNL
ncbi:EAL domain-containing protein [Butyrivibrio sp. YAB3001]|uniref:EAL domain-containing protein n=1 Tax=Butyrivibrio sp. YAB3001 TaxID=1520812 RepID=UPI0008F62022|nr:EAL domain-containing protein [Butyrivibrio sp. YAB3001]SFB73808.1 EAL domain, c-di-GMP-specific phosphodiesterase class I (or its enzymatically inactive variant) [Butyrivibrio sp. YAB3001]